MKKLYFSVACVALALTTSAQTFWTGPAITFTKPEFADWLLPENQDSITPNVRLTRKTSQGLFNIAQESSFQGVPGNSTGSPSPVDTEWAFGSIADGVETLTFAPIVEIMLGDMGENIFNGPLVLHLITDDIYIDVTFTAWSQSSASGGGGGFSYNRSTQSFAGTSDVNGSKKIQIRPNPVIDHLKVFGAKAGTAYSVYDILGSQRLYGHLSSSKQIETVLLPAGIYFIRLEEPGSYEIYKELTEIISLELNFSHFSTKYIPILSFPLS